jgi:serine protease AprX
MLMICAKHRFTGLLHLAALLSISALPTAALAGPSPAARAPLHSASRSYIVQGASAVAAARAVREMGGRVLSPLPLIDAVGAELNARQLARLEAKRRVRVYADRTVSAAGKTTTLVSGTSPDVNLNQFQTNYPMLVGADQLHTAGITGAGVTVAMLDSGLWKNNWNDHYGKRLLAMVDFVGSANGAAVTGDASGHGTHVTSIAASGDYNNAGQYYGVAPKANVVVARAFQANGAASYLDVIKGLNWIVANRNTYNIRVLNLSFGAPPQSYYWDDPLNQAVMKAWAAGIVVVTSAGNSGPAAMTIDVPGNVPYVITAGALTDNYTPYDSSDDRLASFSSTGPTYEGFVKPEVVAPGGHIVATMPSNSYLVNLFGANMKPNGTLFTMSGTSQAAAVTTGVVALMLQSQPTLTPDQVKCKLMAAARPAVTGSGVLAYSVFQQGAGLINAISAINTSATDCANQGLDVAADLAGTAHFGGPANQDASGQYYVMDMQGAQWGQPLSADGFTWSRGYTWGQGYAWSQAYTWSRGFTWSRGYTWSRADTWSQGFTWSRGYTWSRSLGWLEGTFTSQGLTQPMSVDPWVSQE